MITDHDFTLLRALLALAWADGSLAPGELEWIEKVMDQLQIPESQRLNLLASRPPLPSQPELQGALPQGRDRETFLRFLLSVSLEDGETSSEELAMLQELSHKLEVPGSTLDHWRESVTG